MPSAIFQQNHDEKNLNEMMMSALYYSNMPS